MCSDRPRRAGLYVKVEVSTIKSCPVSYQDKYNELLHESLGFFKIEALLSGDRHRIHPDNDSVPSRDPVRETRAIPHSLFALLIRQR